MVALKNAGDMQDKKRSHDTAGSPDNILISVQMYTLCTSMPPLAPFSIRGRDAAHFLSD